MRGRKPDQIVPGAIYKVPTAPAWLAPSGRAEWKRVAPILVERGHLTDADLGTLGAYADAVGQLIDTTKTISCDGMMIETKTGLKKHPLLSTQINARNQIRQLAAELGLTPVSRSRPSIRDDGGHDDSASDLGV